MHLRDRVRACRKIAQQRWTGCSAGPIHRNLEHGAGAPQIRFSKFMGASI
jgi:hypothetical protein